MMLRSPEEQQPTCARERVRRLGTFILFNALRSSRVTFAFLLKVLLHSRFAENSLRLRTANTNHAFAVSGACVWGGVDALWSIDVRLVLPLGGKTVHSRQGLFFEITDVKFHCNLTG